MFADLNSLSFVLVSMLTLWLFFFSVTILLQPIHHQSSWYKRKSLFPFSRRCVLYSKRHHPGPTLLLPPPLKPHNKSPFLFHSLEICLQKASEISRFIVLLILLHLFVQFLNAFHLSRSVGRRCCFPIFFFLPYCRQGIR